MSSSNQMDLMKIIWKLNLVRNVAERDRDIYKMKFLSLLKINNELKKELDIKCENNKILKKHFDVNLKEKLFKIERLKIENENYLQEIERLKKKNENYLQEHERLKRLKKKNYFREYEGLKRYFDFQHGISYPTGEKPTETTIKFRPSRDKDSMLNNGESIPIPIYHHCILEKSFEELRFDYLAESKGQGAATSLFNQPNISSVNTPFEDKNQIPISFQFEMHSHNTANYLDDTAIHIAAKNNHVHIINYFWENKFNIDEQNKFGASPLHYASGNNSLQCLKYLIDKGANIESRDHDMRTPLHWAAWESHLDVVEYLLDKEANINAENHNGWTPLHYAYDNKNQEMVQFLISKGANENFRDNKGNLPKYYQQE